MNCPPNRNSHEMSILIFPENYSCSRYLIFFYVKRKKIYFKMSSATYNTLRLKGLAKSAEKNLSACNVSTRVENLITGL